MVTAHASVCPTPLACFVDLVHWKWEQDALIGTHYSNGGFHFHMWISLNNLLQIPYPCCLNKIMLTSLLDVMWHLMHITKWHSVTKWQWHKMNQFLSRNVIRDRHSSSSKRHGSSYNGGIEFNVGHLLKNWFHLCLMDTRKSKYLTSNGTW